MAVSTWVDCFVSIRFDLDIGPKIESISPPDAITEEGKLKLLHCAFPDCNPDCGYNFIFYFTMPDCTATAAQNFSQTVAPPTTGNTVPELYGAAFYRQKHDPNVPRRYVQQVVVLLSHLPYYNVHELILRVVAPRFCQCCPLSPDTEKVPVSSVLSPVPEAYFEVDHSYTPEHYTQAEVLRDATLELAQWPSPHPQVRYTVTLLQQALVFLTPAHSLRQSIRATRNSCSAARKLMTVDDRVEFMELARGNALYRGSTFGSDVLPLFSLLGDQLHHLTYVWELLIRHEPLFILSNTPCVASATAFSVASLTLPIQFNGTLRSYFTVQNEDFPRLSRMGKALTFPTHEALIVAGTNPFLLRSFSGWPSLLVVMDRNTTKMVNGSVASASAVAPASSAPASVGGAALAAPIATATAAHDPLGVNSSGNSHHLRASGGATVSSASSSLGGAGAEGYTTGSSVPPSSMANRHLSLLDEFRVETPPLPAHATATTSGGHSGGGLLLHHSPHSLSHARGGSSPASPSTAYGAAKFVADAPNTTRGTTAALVSSGPAPGGANTLRGIPSPSPLHAHPNSCGGNGLANINPPAATTPHAITVVPSSSGSGISLSALVNPSPAVKTTATAAAASIGGGRNASFMSPPPACRVDPRAVYTLESSTDGSEASASARSNSSSRSSSRTSSPTSPASTPTATSRYSSSNVHPRQPAANGSAAATAVPMVTFVHNVESESEEALTDGSYRGTQQQHHHQHRSAATSYQDSQLSVASTATSGGGGGVSNTIPLASCTASRLYDAAASPDRSARSPYVGSATSTMMAAPSSSSVTLFTLDNYKTTVESVHAADHRKRGGGHQDTSRSNLQQRLHNYFDSSTHFLLNHAEQTKMMLKRLEMVSLLDAEAQRTSVVLSLNQWQGSPTAVAAGGGGAASPPSSPWRRAGMIGGEALSSSFTREPSSAHIAAGTGGAAGDGVSVSASTRLSSPPPLSRRASSYQHRHTDPTTLEHGTTSCSHFSVADDILRKFFTSLTTEFLSPVTSWFQRVKAPYTAFHLCDRALCDSLFSPTSFLDDFARRHRETAPLMWTQLHSYKAYKLVYERFANGCLFKAYVCQLIDEDLRRQMDAFQIEDWLTTPLSEAERVDLLINLLSTVQRELNETLDPDVLFVNAATSVLASMAVVLQQPHREQFMLKIGELRL